MLLQAVNFTGYRLIRRTLCMVSESKSKHRKSKEIYRKRQADWFVCEEHEKKKKKKKKRFSWCDAGYQLIPLHENNHISSSNCSGKQSLVLILR